MFIYMYAHGTDIVDLKIPDVVNEIADIANWEGLAYNLGLTEADVSKIRGYDQSEHHQRLAEMWYDQDIEYTWSKLSTVLNSPRRRSSVSVISPLPDTYGKL